MLEKELRRESILLGRELSNDAKPLTEDDARMILEDPNLFDYIIVEEFSKKIVGERENLKAIFLTLCGIFVENHQIASYNLCVNSESGAGKDYVVSNILKIFPKQFVESRTRISPTAFTYWHNSKSEPEWNWDGKACYLQDVSEFVLNSEVFKVMVSDGCFATIVIDHKAVDILIRGKPVMIITTAATSTKNEMLRRFPILTLDESVDQTKAIMKRQSEWARKGRAYSDSYSKPVTEALSFLKKVRVKIPFADFMHESYPSDHIIMRTHYQRFLDLIKASAAFHQYQRERDDEDYLIAEPRDYEFAATALRQTTQNSLMIPLTKKQQRFLELCRKGFDDDWFSASEAINKCSFLSSKSVYNYLDKLQECFFDTDSFDVEGSKKPVKKFRIRQLANIKIPTFEDCMKITNNTDNSNDKIVTNDANDNSGSAINCNN